MFYFTPAAVIYVLSTMAAPASPNAFYDAKGRWQPTWKGEDAALQVDSVKVWSLGPTGTEEVTQEYIA